MDIICCDEPDIQFATEGCTECYHCKRCGMGGCANMVGAETEKVQWNDICCYQCKVFLCKTIFVGAGNTGYLCKKCWGEDK